MEREREEDARLEALQDWGGELSRRERPEGREGRREGGEEGEDKDAAPPVKVKPNFGLSGKLREDANNVNGVVLKYSEPADGRLPNRRWRLYPFKNDEPLEPIPLRKKSFFLLGRDRNVADIPLDHPSCSNQHAVIQFREWKDPDELLPLTNDALPEPIIKSVSPIPSPACSSRCSHSSLSLFFHQTIHHRSGEHQRHDVERSQDRRLALLRAAREGHPQVRFLHQRIRRPSRRHDSQQEVRLTD